MIIFAVDGEAGAYEAISPGDTATGITATIKMPTSGAFIGMPAKSALITGEDNTVQFTLDGTAPTAASGTDVGHELTAGQSYIIKGWNSINNFRCIDRVSGSAGKVKVTTFF